jgi:uncharacterized membrane protein YphA (DoxX/SURF4 family)
MTIYTLFLYIGIVALVLTLGLGVFVAKRQEYARVRPLLWFIQYFVGSLLIFSGLVKVVDPLGTAYKMADYFTLLLPILSFMKPFALPFALFMIVLEVVLGVNLILGHGKRMTTGLSFLMMLFFTFLTGYNYMTGFMPEGVGPFEFGKWVEFKETNIRVTDCGCFGDFLKLLPVQTFLKDILLTGFAVYLYLKTDHLKAVISGDKPKLRWIFTGIFTVVTTLACYMNFYFGLPWVDFRPFAEGINIVNAREECALDKPEKLITYVYKNKETGEEQKITNDELMQKEYLWKDKDAEGNKIWEPQSDLTSEVVLKKGCDSKISEMDASKQHAFATNGYALLVVADDLNKSSKAGFKKIAAIADAAREDKIETHAYYYYIKDKDEDGSDEDDLEKFRHELSLAFDFTQSDEKLVKTIIRSSPGLLLLHNGTVVKKWHHRNLPSYDEMKAEFIKPMEAELEMVVNIEIYEPASLDHNFFCSVQNVNKGEFSGSELNLNVLDGNYGLLKKLTNDTTETGAAMGAITLKFAQNPALVPNREDLKKVPNGILTEDRKAWQLVAVETK